MRDRAYLRSLLDSLDIEAVRDMFGVTWHIVRVDPGWCALRLGGGVAYWNGPESLIQHCLRADRLGDLAGQLCVQEFLAGLTNEELARVYGAGEVPDDLFPPAA